MILEGSEQKWNYEFISLEYDVEKVIEDLCTSGLMQKAPAWCTGGGTGPFWPSALHGCRPPGSACHR